MNLIGKNINNSYLVKEKIFEDSISILWFCHSIFSTKKFILKTFKIKNSVNKMNLNNFKKDIEDTYKIKSNYINNVFEMGKFDNNLFLSMEVEEGEILINFLKKSDNIYLKDIIKIYINLAYIINEFNKIDQTIECISCNDFWINVISDKVIHIKLLNFQNIILKKYFYSYELNTLYNKINLSSQKNNIDNNFKILGMIYYQILSTDFELKEIDNFIKFKKEQNSSYKKNFNQKINNIIYMLLSENNFYKNIDELLNDLIELDKKDEVHEMDLSKSRNNNYQYLYEERRKYFELLEKERMKRLKKSLSGNKVYIYTEINENPEEYNKGLFEERKKYYDEIHEQPKRHYKKKLDKIDKESNKIDIKRIEIIELKKKYVCLRKIKKIFLKFYFFIKKLLKYKNRNYMLF